MPPVTVNCVNIAAVAGSMRNTNLPDISTFLATQLLSHVIVSALLPILINTSSSEPSRVELIL